MTTFKKILSVLTVGALLITMALSFTACGEDTVKALTIGGQEINAGLYISYLNSAYNELYSKLTEDASVDSDFDVYAQTYENKSASEWIIDRAVELCAENIAIKNEASRLGVSLESNVKTYIDNLVDYYWTNYNYESILAKVGVGQASFKAMVTSNYLKDELLHAIYGEGGEKEVKNDELAKFMVENYARVKSYTFTKKDTDGNNKTDEELKNLKDEVEGLIAMMKNGGDFDSVIDAYEDLQKQIEEANTTADETTESDTETETETEKDPYERETMIYKESTSPSEEFVKMVFEKTEADYGTPFFYEDDNYYYVVEVLDTAERTDYLEDNKDSILSNYKSDEFDEYIEGLAKALEVTRNEKAIKRYEPKKLGIPAF